MFHQLEKEVKKEEVLLEGIDKPQNNQMMTIIPGAEWV